MTSDISSPDATVSPSEDRPATAGVATVLSSVLVTVFVVLTALILFVSYLYYPVDVAGGSLIGSDSYYWMVVFREFIETGIWHNDIIERSNAPFGESWFRPHPFQIVLFAIFWPLKLFFSTAASLHLTGVLAGPVLGIALCISAMWAASPLLGRHRFWVMPMLFLQYPVLGQILPGLVDHHTLMHLILVVAVGLIIRTLTSGDRLAYAFIAGVVHGVGLWVSVEMFTLLIMTYAGGAAMWLLSPGPDRLAPPVSRWLVSFSLGLIVLVAASVMIEQRPEHWLIADYDRPSIVHVLLSALALSVWLFVDQIDRRGIVPDTAIGRSIILAFVGGGALAILYSAYPDFFHGPFARVDPALGPLLFDITGEMLPIYRHSASIIIGQIGLNVAALPLAIWFAFERRDNWRVMSSWILIAAGLAIYAGFMMVHVRFSAYVSCLAVFPLAFVLGKIIDHSRSHMDFAKGAAVRAAAIFVLVPGAGTLPISIATAEQGPTFGCQAKEIAALLNAIQGQRIILTTIHEGPELLYFTRHSVVGTPYHRNTDGIKDTDRIFSARTDDTARSIIGIRGIDLILLCANESHKGDDPDTLYRRLMEKAPPLWIRPVDLPEPLADTYLLYEIPR
jgi:hypothetical protein